MRILANCKPQFAKSKVSILFVFRFRGVGKFNFADPAFFIFRFGECRAAQPGRRWGHS